MNDELETPILLDDGEATIRHAAGSDRGGNTGSEIPASTGTGTPSDASVTASVWSGLAIGLKARSVAWWLVVGWIVLSVLTAVRLLYQVAREVRIVRRSLPVDDPRLHALAGDVAARLSLRCQPGLRVAVSPFGPTKWCFGKCPLVILTPESLATLDDEQVRSVLLHELAHCQRRDHLWQLLGTFVLCLLPWQPLVWVARSRMRAAAEEACDELVIRAGSSREAYADTLLRLVTTRRPELTPAVGGSRHRLERRIRALLRDGPPQVPLNPRWKVGLMTLCTLSVLLLAAAQPGNFWTTNERTQPRQIQDQPTTQPERPQLAEMITTEELTNHLIDVRHKLDTAQLEYRNVNYSGKSPMPEDWARPEFLDIEIFQKAIINGDRVRDEIVIGDHREGRGYTKGFRRVSTWDGWNHRDRSSRTEPANDVHGERVETGSIDSGWFSNEDDSLDGYWMSVPVKFERAITLVDVMNDPSLLGPFPLDDGRTEWKVHHPTLWRNYEPGYISIIAKRVDDGIRVVQVIEDWFTKGVHVVAMYTFSEELFSEEIPIPREAKRVQHQYSTDRGPTWSVREITLTDAKTVDVTDAMFAPEFEEGVSVIDMRYQMRYEVGGNMITFAREKEGLIRTTEAVRGDVGHNLAHWVEAGELIDPGPLRSYEPITTPDLDLPPGRKHDMGEVENMNWGSGRLHVFTVTNETDKPVTITKIESTGEALRNIWLGYKTAEERGTDMVPGGITGEGTTLEAGESIRMYASMQLGVGLWRHAVILHTDSGEKWTYQLSATGTYTPTARAFIRRAPNDGGRRVEAGVRLWTVNPEREPFELISPEGVRLDFEGWITLTPMHFIGAAPQRQIGHFTLDFSNYEGAYPATVMMRTSEGVDFGIYVREW